MSSHLFSSILLCALAGGTSTCLIPRFNLSINTLQNTTGHWHAEVRLDHDKDYPWDVQVDRRIVLVNGTESIAINAKIIAPTSDDLKLSAYDCSPICSQIWEPTPEYHRIEPFGYYKLHNITHKRNWHDARDTCAQEGSHLLVINSDEEARAIVNLIRKSGTRGWGHWIGIHDQYKEGEYRTIFNETLNTAGFSKWWPEDPWGRSDLNCGAFRYENKHKHGIRDGDCTVLLPFICEREL